MTPLQPSRRVTRHRADRDAIEIALLVFVLALAWAPIVAFVVMCVDRLASISSAEDPVSWRTGPRVGADKNPAGVAANRGGSATLDPAKFADPGSSRGTRTTPAGRSAKF